MQLDASPDVLFISFLSFREEVTSNLNSNPDDPFIYSVTGSSGMKSDCIRLPIISSGIQFTFFVGPRRFFPVFPAEGEDGE